MAYYSDQGATIQQGVGAYFDGARTPTAMAFKDGVFGAPMEADPGPLMAYRDGSLGMYFDAAMAPVSRPVRQRLNGRLMAFRDGSMGERRSGPMPGEEAAYQSGIFNALGLPLYINGQPVNEPVNIVHAQEPNHFCPECPPGSGNENGARVMNNGAPVSSRTADLGIPEGEPLAFHDGVLGPESNVQPTSLPSGHLRAYDDGVLGRQMQLTGLGQNGNGFVVDMKDPQWVKELKAALVYALLMMEISEPANTINEDWYEDPYWNGRATGLTRDWAMLYRDKVNPQTSVGLLVRDAGAVAYPTVTGIVAMVNMGVGLLPTFQQDFPKLYAFMSEMAKLPEGAKLSHFRIVAPWASEASKIRSGSALSMSNVSLMLMGGAALAAVGVVAYTLIAD